MAQTERALSLVSLRAFAVFVTVLMLMSGIASSFFKAVDDGRWPGLPGAVAGGSGGGEEDWTSSKLPAGAPVVPGHEYDTGLSVGLTPSTWILDENTTTNVTVTATVINTLGGAVDGVSLAQRLTANATLLESSIPPSKNGTNLMWPVGRLVANGTYGLTLRLRVTTAAANFTEAISGVLLYGHRSGKAVYSYAAPLRFVDKALSEYLKATVDANKLDPQVIAAGYTLGGDVGRIFSYVQDFVGYEAYRGSLRGARGTLWGMSGNSVDKSNLMVALLRAAGIPCRYATGTLNDTAAKSLLATMFPSGQEIIGFSKASVKKADPLDDPTLLSEAKNHTWVEYYLGQDKWRALDPSFRSAKAGDTFAATSDRFSETPESWRHHVSVKVKVEVWDLFNAMLGKLEVRTVFTSTFATAKLVGVNTYMTHEVTNKGHGPPSLLWLPNPYYYETNTYQDILVIDNETVYGNSYVETLYPNEGYDLYSEEFMAEWLEVEMSTAWGGSTTTTREIYDKIGYENRSWDGTHIPDYPYLELTPPINGIEVYSILVAPTRVPFMAVEQQGGIFNTTYAAYKEALKHNTTAAEKAALDKATKAKHVEFLHLATLELAHLSDARDSVAQQAEQIKSYYVEPRIVIASFEAKEPSLYFILDWRYNEIRALSYPGTDPDQPLRYRAAKGQTDSDTEYELMKEATDKEPVSAASVFAHAENESVPVLIIDSNCPWLIESLNVSRAALKRITIAVDEGKTVIVPQHGVVIHNRTRIAWYELDPTTGSMYSVGENGLHQSLCECMCVISIISILCTVRSTVIGVGGSAEAYHAAMDAYCEAYIAVIDWVEATGPPPFSSSRTPTTPPARRS